mmetsp:Transcript_25773/g.52753  ORF Transcript_25773/g.52753 Transcript_25773/m.52753 type:complete len:238 (-) Transcript_25773:278-991(-)
MHGELRGIMHRKPVVHQTEYALLVLTTIPGAKDDSLLLLNVKHNSNIRVKVVPFPVLVNLGACIDYSEVGLTKVVKILLGGGSDKHIANKMLLPSHFMHKTYLLLRLGVGTAETVKDICLFLCIEIFDCLFVKLLEDFWCGGLVDVVPINIFFRFGSLVQDEPFVLGGAASELASVDGKCVTIFSGGDPALSVGNLMVKQLLVGQVSINSGDFGDTQFVDPNDLTGVGSSKSLGHII